MDKFLSRSSSIPNLVSKRPREEVQLSGDQWQQPKKFAVTKDVPVNNRPETSNRFSTLPVHDAVKETFQNATKKKRLSQIPPILIELIGDWSHQNIKEVIEKYEKRFYLHYKGRNRVKVQCYTAEGHQHVKDGLLKEHVVFHTFARKDEKLPKAVVKGLPKFLQVNLTAELALIGFAGATVSELKTMYTTECPPLLVQLPTGTDMGKFKQIRYISNCVIEVQKYKPHNKAGTQCFRCQSFGHAARNCNRPSRCVKCALDHPTWECTKKGRDEPASCCNCQQNHPANYAQCSERLKYLERIQSKRDILRNNISSKIEGTPRLQGSNVTWAKVAGSAKVNKQALVSAPAPLHQGNDQLLESKWNNSKTSVESYTAPSDNEKNTTRTLPVEKKQPHDLATAEMLEILNTIKSIKLKFINCKTFMDKVILVLTHLGHYV